MLNEIRRVVVLVREEIYKHEDSGTFAARYESLRLTAYGDTEDEACTELKKLFNLDINYYRDKGLLEERLNRLGVKWYWADQYPADMPPYEDTSATGAPASRPAGPKVAWGDSYQPKEALTLVA